MLMLLIATFSSQKVNAHQTIPGRRRKNESANRLKLTPAGEPDGLTDVGFAEIRVW
jgi:hypothetical protein